MESQEVIPVKHKMRDSRIRTLDLFSGIGGFSYGLRSVCKTVGYCEKSLQCQSVLSARMSEELLDSAPLHTDVNNLTCNDFPSKPEMLTAGFPCQDIAVSNVTGKGLQGCRSGLIWTVCDILEDIKSIKYVFLENSPNIVNRGVESLKQKLRDIGFRTISSGVFTAKSVGAPHLRRRWFCFASKTKHLRDRS